LENPASLSSKESVLMANAVRKDELRNAIANAVAENVMAYDVADVCVSLLGLEPQKDGWRQPLV
jgi:hypothetical protein